MACISCLLDRPWWLYISASVLLSLPQPLSLSLQPHLWRTSQLPHVNFSACWVNNGHKQACTLPHQHPPLPTPTTPTPPHTYHCPPPPHLPHTFPTPPLYRTTHPTTAHVLHACLPQPHPTPTPPHQPTIHHMLMWHCSACMPAICPAIPALSNFLPVACALSWSVSACISRLGINMVLKPLSAGSAGVAGLAAVCGLWDILRHSGSMPVWPLCLSACIVGQDRQCDMAWEERQAA